ncbi:MAG: hypothetical protein R6W79_02415, partial [Acidimicrobiia bacterium]
LLVAPLVDQQLPDVHLGELLVNQGRYEEAEDRLVNAVRVLRATGENSMATFAEMFLARVHLERQQYERAEAVLAGVIEEATEIGFAIVMAEAPLHLADLARRRGQPEAALVQLREALKNAGEVASAYQLTESRFRAQALAELGREGEALATLDASLAMAEARDQYYDIAMLLSTKADILGTSDPAAAQAVLARAALLKKRPGIRT